jgi:hypothetical protein
MALLADKQVSQYQSKVDEYLNENSALKVQISRLKQKSPLFSQHNLSSFDVWVQKEEKMKTETRDTGITCTLLDLDLIKMNHSADINELNGEIKSLEGKLENSESLLTEAQALLDEQIASQQEQQDEMDSKEKEFQDLQNRLKSIQRASGQDTDAKSQQIQVMTLEQE